MSKEGSRKDMNAIINDVDGALANASLFVEDLGPDVERALDDLTEALERFRTAVDGA